MADRYSSLVLALRRSVKRAESTVSDGTVSALMPSLMDAHQEFQVLCVVPELVARSRSGSARWERVPGWRSEGRLRGGRFTEGDWGTIGGRIASLLMLFTYEPVKGS